MYPPELVTPMKEQLTSQGFQSLEDASSVQQALSNKGTTLVVLNSVCGCAASNARPGAIAAVQNTENQPTQLVTAFAGVDKEAVNKVREYLQPFPPSSPCIALFKDGDLVHMLERHHIEGRSAQIVADNLMAAFEEHCI